MILGSIETNHFVKNFLFLIFFGGYEGVIGGKRGWRDSSGEIGGGIGGKHHSQI